jgi:nitronate monooxygenase
VALDEALRAGLTLPAVCAPMYRVSNPALVIAACTNGLIGGLPRQNVRELAEFDAWLAEVRRGLDLFAEANPDAPVGAVAVNLSRMPEADLARHLAVCSRHGVRLFISAMGDPAELTRRVHDIGGRVWHDVTTVRFAEKAIAAGVDGLTCIGAGGGGHSGTISPMALIPKVRAMFAGTIVMAGAVAHGAAIRAAEVLGADLAYVGTRFIATREASAPSEYKAMLATSGAADLVYAAFGRAPASWLKHSLDRAGVAVNEPLPDSVRPWRDIWSAGQGVELIDGIPPAADVIGKLKREYVDACARPDHADRARAL